MQTPARPSACWRQEFVKVMSTTNVTGEVKGGNKRSINCILLWCPKHSPSSSPQPPGCEQTTLTPKVIVLLAEEILESKHVSDYWKTETDARHWREPSRRRTHVGQTCGGSSQQARWRVCGQLVGRPAGQSVVNWQTSCPASGPQRARRAYLQRLTFGSAGRGQSLRSKEEQAGHAFCRLLQHLHKSMAMTLRGGARRGGGHNCCVLAAN